MGGIEAEQVILRKSAEERTAKPNSSPGSPGWEKCTLVDPRESERVMYNRGLARKLATFSKVRKTGENMFC